jgi:septal ring factor EnvC (AmiA/AmiB activator)
MRNFFLSFLFAQILINTLLCQRSTEQIQKNRDNALKEIEFANQLLLETEGKAKESLNEINLINHKLNKRKEYILGTELEVNILSSVIEENINSAESVQQEISKIKKIYGQLIFNLYKNRSSDYRIMYFLASENMSQLYKRVQIVRIFNGYLRNRRMKLEQLRNELLSKNKELEKLRNEKALLVKSVKKESEVIEREIIEKRRIVTQLKNRKKEIENEIKEKERTAKRLENELRRVIEEERRIIKASGTKELLTPNERIISTDFEKNVGRLPWPTEQGIITGQYGEHQHPDYKFVTVRNDGIYISTSSGGNARSIFKGIISRVFTIPGENYTVIIKHGEYYTLYHNLINVKVKTGQNVNTKEVIGTVFTNEKTKETVLYFQIWKETERKDPELWLVN